MVRVGIPVTAGWFGGINYLKNLVRAVSDLSSREVEIVLLVGKNTPADAVRHFPPVPVTESNWFDYRSPKWALRQASQLFIGANPPFEAFLKKEGIQVLSHSDALGHCSEVRTLGWIPDFQHTHLPQLFSKGETLYRDTRFRNLANKSTRIILSSNAAKQDLHHFAPPTVERARILQFVTNPTRGLDSLATPEELKAKYGVKQPYFYLPNQFWVHKNHELVINALGMLRENGEVVRVICSGVEEDRRHPQHVKNIKSKITDLALERYFVSLGVVPYRDLVSLMAHSVAVVNPSRSEGWSTTVEEAKSLGKRVILSNINVHREQNPPNAVLVDPDEPGQMASALMAVMSEFSKDQDEENMRSAAEGLHERIEQFAQNYQEIILDAMHNKGPLS